MRDHTVQMIQNEAQVATMATQLRRSDDQAICDDSTEFDDTAITAAGSQGANTITLG